MVKIAILGCTGRLGTALVEAAWAENVDFVAISRSKPELPNGAKWIQADARDRSSLEAALKTASADVLINCLNPPYKEWKRNAVMMADNVVRACGASNTTHIFPGNLYNYSNELPDVIGAETEQNPDTGKGRIRSRMENHFYKAALKDECRTITVRCGDYFGGTQKGSWFDKCLAQNVHQGVFTYPGPMDAKHSWAYLPDLAAALIKVARASVTHEYSSYMELGFSGYTSSGRAFHDALKKVSESELEVKHLPWTIIRLGGIFHSPWKDISELRHLWIHPHEIDGSSLEEFIGPVETTPFEVAVGQAYAQMKQ